MDEFFEDTPGDPSGILAAGGRAARGRPGLEPGELIRTLRRGVRITQTAVAREAGLQRTRVCEIERGRAVPRWSELAKLLAAVGCAPVLLARGVGWVPGLGRWRRDV